MWVIQRKEKSDFIYVSIKWKKDENPYLLLDNRWEQDDEKIPSLLWKIIFFKIRHQEWDFWPFRSIQLWLEHEDEKVILSCILESRMWWGFANILLNLPNFDDIYQFRVYRSQTEKNRVFIRKDWVKEWIWRKYDWEFLNKEFWKWKKYDMEKMNDFYETELLKKFAPLIKEETKKDEKVSIETTDTKDDLPF